MPVKKSCLNCDSDFETLKSRVERSKYCSRQCVNKHRSEVYVGSSNPNWQGGVYKSRGWVWVYCPGHHRATERHPHVPEQTLVMENYLGRKLFENEQVHHINGVKDDNRLENLELLTIEEHSRRHYEERIIDEKGRFVKCQ